MIDPAWSAVLPDIPRWVELRSLLLHGEGTVFGEPTGGVIVSGDGFTVGLVGYPDSSLVDKARPLFAPDAEAVVIGEGLEHAISLFPLGRPRRAILHRLDGEIEAVSDETLDIASVDDRLLHSLPPELATEVEGAYIAAFRRVEGLVVSACSAASITETLWDVGIDTLEGHRRMGHARSCYLALASHLAAQGLSPVWGAYEDNEPSLSMARSLGFTQVDEIWVIELEDENRQAGAL